MNGAPSIVYGHREGMALCDVTHITMNGDVTVYGLHIPLPSVVSIRVRLYIVIASFTLEDIRIMCILYLRGLKSSSKIRFFLLTLIKHSLISIFRVAYVVDVAEFFLYYSITNRENFQIAFFEINHGMRN